MTSSRPNGMAISRAAERRRLHRQVGQLHDRTMREGRPVPRGIGRLKGGAGPLRAYRCGRPVR